MLFVDNRSLRSRAQHLLGVHVGQAKGWQCSGKKNGEHGKSDGGGINRRIGTQIEEDREVRLLDIAHEPRAHPLRQHDTGGRTGTREDGALGHELPQQPHPPGAERAAHHQFLLPVERA